MKINNLEKYSIQIYEIILIFSILYYFLLFGASGHQFNISFTDKIGLITALCGIIIVPNFKNNLIKKVKKVIQTLSLIISVSTLILGIIHLIYLFGFKFGDDINLVIIGLSYFIPLIFITVNGIIIREIFIELLK